MTTLPARPRLLLFASLLTTLLVGGVQAEQVGQSHMPLSITIKRGDTVYSIARAHGLSVDLVLAYNNMTDTHLEVGQVLHLVPQTYTAQPGDTVYSIARQFGLNPNAILATNTLPKDVKLQVGQVLALPVATTVPTPAPQAAAQAQVQVNAEAAAPAVSDARANVAPAGAAGTWYANAMALVGTPYLLGGTTPQATDCSGFVLQVMTPLGIRLPRTSAEQARAGIPVSRDDLRAGDLVFFETMGKGKVSHVGIYLGNGQFVNANSHEGKVVVEDLWKNDYWAKRYVSARRVLVEALAEASN